MHERLAEMRQSGSVQETSQPDGPSPVAIEVLVEETEEEVGLKQEVAVEEQGEPEEALAELEPNQPDFDFRLSMLPVWARKAALSRPSVAQHAKSMHTDSTSATSKTAEGRWAEVQ